MAETEQKPEIEPQNAEPQETEPKKRRTKKVSWHVLPASMAGGPHGVGKEISEGKINLSCVVEGTGS